MSTEYNNQDDTLIFLPHPSSIMIDDEDAAVFFGSLITSPEKRAERRLEEEYEMKENDHSTILNRRKSSRRQTNANKGGRRDTVVMPLRRIGRNLTDRSGRENEEQIIITTDIISKQIREATLLGPLQSSPAPTTKTISTTISSLLDSSLSPRQYIHLSSPLIPIFTPETMYTTAALEVEAECDSIALETTFTDLEAGIELGDESDGGQVPNLSSSTTDEEEETEQRGMNVAVVEILEIDSARTASELSILMPVEIEVEVESEIEAEMEDESWEDEDSENDEDEMFENIVDQDSVVTILDAESTAEEIEYKDTPELRNAEEEELLDLTEIEIEIRTSAAEEIPEAVVEVRHNEQISYGPELAEESHFERAPEPAAMDVVSFFVSQVEETAIPSTFADESPDNSGRTVDEGSSLDDQHSLDSETNIESFSLIPSTPGSVSTTSSEAVNDTPLQTVLDLSSPSATSSNTVTPEPASHTSVTPKASSVRRAIPSFVYAAPTAKRLLSKPTKLTSEMKAVDTGVRSLGTGKRESGLIATGTHINGVKLGGARNKIVTSSAVSSSSLSSTSTLVKVFKARLPTSTTTISTTSPPLSLPASTSIIASSNKPVRPPLGNSSSSLLKRPLITRPGLFTVASGRNTLTSPQTTIDRPISAASTSSTSSFISSSNSSATASTRGDVTSSTLSKKATTVGHLVRSRNSNEGTASQTKGPRFTAPSSTFGSNTGRRVGAVAGARIGSSMGRPPFSSSISSILPPSTTRVNSLPKSIPSSSTSLLRQPTSTTLHQSTRPTSASSSEAPTLSRKASSQSLAPATSAPLLPRPLPTSASLALLVPIVVSSSPSIPIPIVAAAPLLPRPMANGAGIILARAKGVSKSPDRRRALRAGEKHETTAVANKGNTENVRPPPMRTQSAKSVLASAPIPTKSSSLPPKLMRSISVPSFHSITVVSAASTSFQPMSPINTRPRSTPVEPLVPLTSSAITTATFAADNEPVVVFISDVIGIAVDHELLGVKGGAGAKQSKLFEGAEGISSSSRTTRRTGVVVSTVPLPRPTRQRVNLVVEADVVEEEEESATASASIFVLPIYTPFPSQTLDELSTRTQANTKRNKAWHNKLKVETILIDAMRPPSPTSKIRKSLGAGGSASSSLGGGNAGGNELAMKESREERAKKRRGALRSSTDGSEIMRLAEELDDEKRNAATVAALVTVELMNHFRAAGDDEEYRSPIRTVARKGKKKSSVASLSGSRKRVKWDKALVYDGMVENEEPSGEGILKRMRLDDFGNSMEKTPMLDAKCPAVPIKRLIYKDDERP